MARKLFQEVRRDKEKRDAVVAFVRHCESQQKFATAEIERIQKRRAIIARVQEELESCLIPVVEQYAAPDRRIQRLDGNFLELAKRNPESVKMLTMPAWPQPVSTTSPLLGLQYDHSSVGAVKMTLPDRVKALKVTVLSTMLADQGLPRPYIWRFRSLRRWTCPSTCPLLQCCSTAATTAS